MSAAPVKIMIKIVNILSSNRMSMISSLGSSICSQFSKRFDLKTTFPTLINAQPMEIIVKLAET